MRHRRRDPRVHRVDQHRQCAQIRMCGMFGPEPPERGRGALDVARLERRQDLVDQEGVATVDEEVELDQ
jgi:hypothetical protein